MYTAVEGVVLMFWFFQGIPSRSLVIELTESGFVWSSPDIIIKICGVALYCLKES